jgi:polyhydroxybutyrate depolymerase
MDNPGVERRTNRTFDRLADREGFVVVYPDAEGGRWNEGWPRTDGPLGRGDEIDDVGFLSALIDSVCKEFDVDPRRVYATGLSNGASMVYRLACERENKVAAIAPVAGGIADPVAKRCKDGRPVPLLVIHGTSDAIVPYEMAVPKNLAQWMQRDVCPTPPEIAYLPDVDENDGTRTRLEHHRQCKDDSEISLYVIEGGGHRWPGDDTVKPFAHLGRYSRDFDAASVIWDFFKRHRLP